MGVKFLKKGDPRPPPVEPGNVRLYSMLYCPYAQRVRLALAAKGVPFEMVDINLKNKPEWLSAVNPQSKVPALEFSGGDVVIESLDIADYVDSKFPGPALWPTDPEAKAHRKRLLDEFVKAAPLFLKGLWSKDEQTAKESLPDAVAALQTFEEELAKLGTKFFGGSRPDMLDLMAWPWAERGRGLGILHPGLKLPTEKFPKLMAWGAAMKDDPAVAASLMNPEAHVRFFKAFLDGTLDYDKL